MFSTNNILLLLFMGEEGGDESPGQGLQGQVGGQRDPHQPWCESARAGWWGDEEDDWAKTHQIFDRIVGVM
jgi:hypothetical protein